MKTVLLLRHAKSDWGDPTLPDFDRPLSKRGLKDAPRMGEVLARFGSIPDKILSSPAQRARQTAQLVAEACGYKKSIQYIDAFYGAGSDDLMAALQQLSEDIERVMLVGHNPTMEETAATLLSEINDTGWSDEWSIRIPTAGLLCFDVSVTSWAALSSGDAMLRWFLIPKLVKSI